MSHSISLSLEWNGTVGALSRPGLLEWPTDGAGAEPTTCIRSRASARSPCSWRPRGWGSPGPGCTGRDQTENPGVVVTDPRSSPGRGRSVAL
eukprot:7948515-Pyramimonas_sp.AAC.1